MYDVKAKKKIGDAKIGNGSRVAFINILDEEFSCIANDDPAVYVCPLKDASKQPMKLDTTYRNIVCMKTSSDRKTVVIGFENSTIEFWKYFHEKQDFQLLKQIREDFKIFDIDPLCASILLLNTKCRDIEFHLIEWEWDTTAIEEDLKSINLDFENIKDDFADDNKKGKLQISDGKGKKRSQTAC